MFVGGNAAINGNLSCSEEIDATGLMICNYGEPDIVLKRSDSNNNSLGIIYLANAGLTTPQMALGVRLDSDTSYKVIRFSPTSFYPGTNNSISLGGSSYKWTAVYTQATAINSSKYVKENIKPIEDEEALKLLDVNTVSFDYINENEPNDCRGVIAEEVYELFPHVVVDWDKGEDDEGNKIYPGVDYSKFIPELIKLCQIQQKQIDELTERVNTLESSNKDGE